MSWRTLLWNSKQQPPFETFAQEVHRNRRVRDALYEKVLVQKTPQCQFQDARLLLWPTDSQVQDTRKDSSENET